MHIVCSLPLSPEDSSIDDSVEGVSETSGRSSVGELGRSVAFALGGSKAQFVESPSLVSNESQLAAVDQSESLESSADNFLILCFHCSLSIIICIKFPGQMDSHTYYK